MRGLRLLVVGLGALTAMLWQEKEEETVSETDSETVSRQSATQPSTYKRGYRFTDPETGEALQVRAVGGRPSHKTAHA